MDNWDKALLGASLMMMALSIAFTLVVGVAGIVLTKGYVIMDFMYSYPNLTLAISIVIGITFMTIGMKRSLDKNPNFFEDKS